MKIMKLIANLSQKLRSLFDSPGGGDSEIAEIIARAEKYREKFSRRPIIERTPELLTDYYTQPTLLDKTGNIIIKTENGQKVYFRGIVAEKADAFKELYAIGILQALADTGRLVGIRLTDYYTEDFPLIFALETLRCVPEWAWTWTMKKEAAINMLVIDAALRHYGYGLWDGHFGNTTFKRNRPLFLDIGSLVKGRSPYFIGEVHQYALNLLLRQKYRWIKRKLLKGFIRQDPVKIAHVDCLLPNRPQGKTVWQDYHGGYTVATAPTGHYARIIELVRQFSPEAKTCGDLAGNAGYVAHLLAQTGQFTAIVNLDYDENAIESGREKFRDERIEFYCADTMRGAAIADVVKSDIVFALALTHHLLLTQNYNLHAVLSIIARYTNRYAYVEFCPLGMYSGESPDYLPPIPAWYNDDWFAKSFRRFFRILHREVVGRATVAGQERDHRILYIGENR